MIEVRNLTFSYKESKKPVLRNINLKINKGEFVGIAGATGSGKTTFALCMNGIIPHSIEGKFSGDVEILGKNTKYCDTFELARYVGLVFQDPDSQIFSLDVKSEVSFGPENLGMEKDELEKAVNESLKIVGIENLRDKETFALSAGQKQKVCIASVLAMNPEIIVLDEPTSQLDFKSTKEIYMILEKLSKSGKTIIVIEHKSDLLMEYASRVLILDNGKFVLDGKPSDVFRNFRLLEIIGIEVPKVLRFERFLRRKGVKTSLNELMRV